MKTATPKKAETKIPAELPTALANDKVIAAKFKALAASHQREYIKWIEDAKRPETRQKRIESTIKRLAKSS